MYRQCSQSSIVITGMGVVTPLGCRTGQVVEAIRAGVTAIEPVQLGEDLPLLMGLISPAEFAREDEDMALPYCIAAAKSAWIDAGLDQCEVDPWQVATVVGSSKGRIGNLGPGASGRAPVSFNPGTFSGDTIGLGIARELGLNGPALNYPAACATGIVCVIRAIQALRAGEADIALAGSGEDCNNPLLMAGFQNMGALDRQLMRPFDIRRGGFNAGEGAAVFVLEREADAVARGAPIIARIVGWDHRSDAFHITSADPEAGTVAHAISRAITAAEWDPPDVEYINAHGTGTLLNDQLEGRAIGKALPGCNPLVSGLKPYIGHLLGASAAVELALALASLKAGFVPPTPGLEDPDPQIPLHFVPPGGVHKQVRRFLKLSLGFGGHIGVIALDTN